jgi:hypothetical protein
MNKLSFISVLIGICHCSFTQIELSQYNVIWDSPGTGPYESMPIGNGDIGMNLWVEEGGDLLFYISKTDSWSENGRLLKLARIRVKLDPDPFRKGLPFRQELDLMKGEIIIEAGRKDSSVRLRVWPDANHPVINVESESNIEHDIGIETESWRTRPHEPVPWQRRADGTGRTTTIGDVYNVLPFDQPYAHKEKMIIEPDTFLDIYGDRVIWCHHNHRSTWNIPMEQQGLKEFMKTETDPLLNRAFGGMITGDGFHSEDTGSLESGKKRRKHRFSVVVLTAHPVSIEQWVNQILDLGNSIQKIPLEKRRAAHQAWWKEFWNRSWIIASGSKEAEAVTRAYILQRFMNASAGRGAFPIKFNGSIFTVEDPQWGSGDPDYRRWGPGYWFQNTRLPYWSMLYAGDYDLMHPFFSMYSDMLPLALERTRIWYGHEGAFFPETANFWGTFAADHYGWKRDGLDVSFVKTPQVRRHWEGGLELCAMMLEYYKHTGEEDFAKNILIPVLSSVLEFYVQHYEKDGNGLLYMAPSQALETWFDCINPMPDVAGLHWVIREALFLPDKLADRDKKDSWFRLYESLPEIPVRNRVRYYSEAGRSESGMFYDRVFPLKDGKTALSPAEQFAQKRNRENPELYAVFPFRLYAFNRPNTELAINAYNNRLGVSNIGWSQDPIQAAYLGLTEEAGKLVYERTLNCYKESRFPVMWGPNYDWIPDQTHGGVFMYTLQSMLIQTDGDEIYLFPAWPKEWNVDFKLHVPDRKVLQGKMERGELIQLDVLPASGSEKIINVYAD